MKKLVIAVDGPAGSGKSETFRRVADQVGYEFIDTGLMYRAFTLLGLQEAIDFTQPHEVEALIPRFTYAVAHGRVLLNDQDVTAQLTAPAIVAHINFVSSNPAVREMMVTKQRALGHAGATIVLGRDITSVVLPDADLKVYLDASVDARATRRYAQQVKGGASEQPLADIKAQIISRDLSDTTRAVGPLQRVSDAWYIDNSDVTMNDVVTLVVNKIRSLEKA